MRDTFAPSDHANRLASVLRYGHVETVDHEARRCRVTFEDDWTSDDLPWMERRAGTVRTWSPPSVGEQVMVLSPSGELAGGIVLLGAPSDAFPAAGDRPDIEAAETEDGFRDELDGSSGHRTITVPADGKLTVVVGETTAVEVSADRISLKVGTAELVIADGAIVLTGDVRLGATGGTAIARHGDNVVANKVVASSVKVKSV